MNGSRSSSTPIAPRRAPAATILVALSAIVGLQEHPAIGQVIYSENFESYASGNALAGSGGWQLAGAPFDLLSPVVGPGSGLGSKVMDGRSASVIGSGSSRLIRPISWTLAGRGTLTFDAYAFGVEPSSQALTLGFGALPLSNLGAVYWEADSAAYSGLRWALLGPAGDIKFEAAGPAGFDRPVHMGIVLDAVAGEYWGTYDFGGGVQETGRYSITRSQIDALDYLQTHLYLPTGQPLRGGELDNISLAVGVPEPRTTFTALLCVAFGAVSSVWRWKQRGTTADR